MEQTTKHTNDEGTEQSEATTLGDLLARLREDRGLSLFELGKRTGIHRSTLMRIESGSSAKPDIETLNALARALDTDPEEFYDAIWQDTAEPLPSPSIYLRSKYNLSERQARQAEQILEQFTDLTGQ
jgi:transcriptional regulator with XRE-family HTH domain